MRLNFNTNRPAGRGSLDALFAYMEPQISILRGEAKEFGAKGGNETLFWAGKMSDLAGILLRSDLRSMSETATLLGQVKREYDNRIISSANTSVSGPCPPTKDDTNKNQLSGG
jgi:hypothetical protein